MMEQFEQAFGYIGWGKFWDIDEECSVLLTKEFLMTLRVEELTSGTTIHFHLFDTDYVVSERQMSNLLGFSSCCSLTDEPTGFDARDFWEEIYGEGVSGKYSITKIHNPTLRFLGRGVSLVVFPCAEAHCTTAEDLKCLYAMVMKIHFAPVLDIVKHWVGMVKNNTPITITAFVMGIATNLGVLENAQLEYLPHNLTHLVGERHFVQGHFLWADAKGNLIMTYSCHRFQVPLLAPHIDLYKVTSLTMQLDMEPLRSSFAGVMTRGQKLAATQWQVEMQEGGEGTSHAPQVAPPPKNVQGEDHASYYEGSEQS